MMRCEIEAGYQWSFWLLQSQAWSFLLPTTPPQPPRQRHRGSSNSRCSNKCSNSNSRCNRKLPQMRRRLPMPGRPPMRRRRLMTKRPRPKSVLRNWPRFKAAQQEVDAAAKALKSREEEVVSQSTASDFGKVMKELRAADTKYQDARKSALESGSFKDRLARHGSRTIPQLRC